MNCISYIALISQPGVETKYSECFVNCVESLKCRLILLQSFVYPKIYQYLLNVPLLFLMVLSAGFKEEFGFLFCFPLLQVIKTHWKAET